MSEGETPVVFAEGETPGKSVGEETPIFNEVHEPEEGGLREIIDLVDVPEEADPPLNHRESRWRTRRSLLDEVDEQVEDAPRSDEEDEAEGRRLVMERKRIGKNTANPQPRKSTRTASVKEVKVPLLAPAAESEEEEEYEEEVPNYERTEIWVTKKLLGTMGKFDDSKRSQTYKERSAVGKLAKSGKRYDAESLRHIESEEEFLSYIQDIGFDWLLKHSDHEVPLAAAREFFSTFRFKATTDPDADSISFWLFTVEHLMSIREWSLRMGLFTSAEDEEGIWNERMIGPPRNISGFAPQSAWEAITHRRSGTFKTSVSKGFHITNHLLRFAQEFIGYNLMGTSSSDLTTTELYFTWCISKRIKVHLGYWLAQACHQMTVNPSRQGCGKEMVAVREELGGVRSELQAIKGSIDMLAERSSAQNGRMADAVKLMKKMAEWLEENFSQA